MKLLKDFVKINKTVQLKVLYFILDKKRASSKLVRQTSGPFQNSRHAPPTSQERTGLRLPREKRGLRLPLSRQAEPSFLSWQAK